MTKPNTGIPNELRVRMERKPDPRRKVAPSVCYPGEFIVSAPIPGTYGCCATETMDGKKLERPLFGVPLTDDEQALAIRAHEYVHLQLETCAPKLCSSVKKLDMDWVNAALDNTVNGYARACGMTDINNLPLPEMQKNADRKTKAQIMLQTMSTGNAQVGLLDSTDYSVVSHAARAMQDIGMELAISSRSDAKLAKKATQVISDLIAYFEADKQLEEQEQNENTGSTAPKLVPSDTGTIPGLDGIKHHARDNGKPYAGWMDLILTKLPLPKKVPRKLVEPKHVAGFTGGFRNPLRALIPAFDGAAWDRRKKHEGGTILLDMSGSMGLLPKHIAKLLETAPHATIAGYSGNTDTNKCPLYILAEKGKYVGKIPRVYGANGGDGPALKWLGKQKWPRLWISDGVVTGKNESQHPRLYAEAIAICKRYGIARIDNIEEYLALCGRTEKQ